MTNLSKLSGAALALLVGAPSAVLAQAIPGIPGPAAAMGVPAAGAAVPAAGAAVPAAAPVAAAPRNIWSFLCMTPAQAAACKAKFCNSGIGKLINNSLAPMSAFTGGVIGQPCPMFPASALGMDPTSAQGAAAQIQKDTAEAAARRAAVRYLSTVDCNWWDQAREALINSLRADKNECVRLEAALALQRGCCCNAPVIKALVNTLSVFPDDANPPEDSPRVRSAAMAALDHCLSCYVAIAPAPTAAPLPPPKEGLPPPGEMLPPPKAPPLGSPPPVPSTQVSGADARGRIQPAAYHPQAQQQSMEQLVQHARRVLQLARQQPRKQMGPFAPGERSLLDVIENALHPPAPPPSMPKKSLGMNNNCCTPLPQTAFNGGGISPEPPVLTPQPQLLPACLAPQPQTRPAAYSPSLRAPTPPIPQAQANAEGKRHNSPTLRASLPPPPPAPLAHVGAGESRLNLSPLPAPPSPAQVSLTPKQSMTTSAGSTARSSTATKSPSADPVIVTSKPAPSQPPLSLTKPKTKPTAIVAPTPPAISTRATASNREHQQVLSVSPTLTVPTKTSVPNRVREQVVVVSPTPPAVSTRTSTSTWEHKQAVSAAPTPPTASMPVESHASPTVPQLIACLQSSPSPDKRMWAVQSLISGGEATPTVVQALMTGAATDTSDVVRFSCVHGLLQLGITDPSLLAKLDWPLIDGDPHVREAAWRVFLFGNEAPDDPRVRAAARELNQLIPSRSSMSMPGRS